VFLKSVVSTPGDLSWERPYLIGMIIGHQGIKLENILIQPDTAILKFEKGSVETNWGLATCVWADDILEIANMALNLDVK
jgi:hypothetical protein